jgi:hypothetical protein
LNEWAKGAQVSENYIVVGHSNPEPLFNVIEKEQLASIPCHDKYTFNPGIGTSQTSLLVRCNGVLFVGSRSLRSQRGLSLYKILEILSVTVFEKKPILEGFSNFSDEITDAEPCIQLNLFDF